MLVLPANRITLMIRLRGAAMIWGAEPVRTWDRCSSADQFTKNPPPATFPLSWVRYLDELHRGPERMQEEIPWEH